MSSPEAHPLTKRVPMNKVFLSVKDLCYRYPSPMEAPLAAWQYHLLKWRREGIITTPGHWYTQPGMGHAVVYWEVKVIKIIYDNRTRIGFHNLIYTHNKEAIHCLLTDYASSVKQPIHSRSLDTQSE